MERLCVLYRLCKMEVTLGLCTLNDGKHTSENCRRWCELTEKYICSFDILLKYKGLDGYINEFYPGLKGVDIYSEFFSNKDEQEIIEYNNLSNILINARCDGPLKFYKHMGYIEFCNRFCSFKSTSHKEYLRVNKIKHEYELDYFLNDACMNHIDVVPHIIIDRENLIRYYVNHCNGDINFLFVKKKVIFEEHIMHFYMLNNLSAHITVITNDTRITPYSHYCKAMLEHLNINVVTHRDASLSRELLEKMFKCFKIISSKPFTRNFKFWHVNLYDPIDGYDILEIVAIRKRNFIEIRETCDDVLQRDCYERFIKFLTDLEHFVKGEPSDKNDKGFYNYIMKSGWGLL